ncbi:hypothetical protein LOAG_07554 [Loa loa]|uniref:Uncharacterized protein n=1 Tax=Loa loa TaxID=7209 RepID=A0A1S0TVH5_LOALO|nr:hypothetical protein LOAG_07554 [Loa loa]EFO20937.2 hypothetical protein LOAG_07554 [Loa loa]
MHNINPNCGAFLKKFQQTNSSLAIIETKGPFVGKLSVKMLKKEWNVCTGDMIMLFGVVLSDNLDLNISWYIGTKAIISGGRYRYWRKGFDCCLEIFDCDVSDSGDIVCIVEATNCIASDISVLRVNDDDLAGIEPKFLQLLKYDEIYDCVQLACRVSGFPIPYVTFYFRNRRIINSQRISKL